MPHSYEDTTGLQTGPSVVGSTDLSGFTFMDTSEPENLTTSNTAAIATLTRPSNSDLRPFVFLQLPGELRNQIYDYLFESPEDGETHAFEVYQYSLYPGHRHVSKPEITVGILGTCKQIYKEAKPLLYERVLFNVHDGDDGRRFDLGFVPPSYTPVASITRIQLKLYALPQGLDDDKMYCGSRVFDLGVLALFDSLKKVQLELGCSWEVCNEEHHLPEAVPLSIWVNKYLLHPIFEQIPKHVEIVVRVPLKALSEELQPWWIKAIAIERVTTENAAMQGAELERHAEMLKAIWGPRFSLQID